MRSVAASAALLVGLGTVSCGDSPEGGTGVDAFVEPSGPLFLVGGVTISTEGRNGYGVLVPALNDDREVRLEDAISVPGQPAIAASPNRNGRFYVGLDESPVVQAYEANVDGSAQLIDELSFAPFGASAASGPLVVPNDERAYVFDLNMLSMYVFDPQRMELIEAVDLDVNTPPGGSHNFSFPARDDERILLAINTFRADGTAAPRSRMAFIDTRTSAVTYADIEGCGRLGWSAKDAEGNLYFATHPAQAGLVFGGLAGDPAAPPCMASVARGTATFRPGFVDLAELAGAPAGGLAQGPDGTAYILVFDDEATPVTEANGDTLSLSLGWTYVQVDLAAERLLEPLAALGEGVGVPIDFSVDEGDGDVTPFIVTIGPLFSSGTIYDVSQPDVPVARLTIPGIPFGALRLR
ncbi:MAG: hypothetical protein AAF411_07880 [Myxococcota bacterium]